MPSKKEGVMIVLSSPSGAGKTTLVKLLSQRNDYVTSISHTTRKPRSNEVNGKDYFFVNETEFMKMINQMNFLNTQEYLIIFTVLQNQMLFQIWMMEKM